MADFDNDADADGIDLATFMSEYGLKRLFLDLSMRM